jgi:hypothetical protein
MLFFHFPDFLPTLGFYTTFGYCVTHNDAIRVESNVLKVPLNDGMCFFLSLSYFFKCDHADSAL